MTQILSPCIPIHSPKSNGTQNPILKQGMEKFHRAAALARRIGKGILEIESRGFRPLTLDPKYIQELKGPSSVRFLTSSERLGFSVQASNGKLVQRNKLYLTRGEAGQPPNHAFIISPDKQLYAAPLQPGKFHHSSFYAGGALIFAGEMETDREGRIVQISNRSGHYKPGKAHFLQALRCIKNWGIDLKKVELHEYDPAFPDRFSVFSTGQTYLDQLGLCTPEEIKIIR